MFGINMFKLICMWLELTEEGWGSGGFTWSPEVGLPGGDW